MVCGTSPERFRHMARKHGVTDCQTPILQDFRNAPVTTGTRLYAQASLQYKDPFGKGILLSVMARILQSGMEVSYAHLRYGALFCQAGTGSRT